MTAKRICLAAWLAGLLCATSTTLSADSVKVWEEKVVIPTYLAGDPEPNPMFYFGRPSQGAEGRVYPYPLYDTLTGKKADKEYLMVYLENEYVRLGIMPEIGGRLFEGMDKTNNYHFIYKQHVIKPALIGLIGAWISGGIEWNIPHHHRASTFLPVQHSIAENPDGSKTVWVGELEVRHRTRWAVGYTLRPGKSYMEVSLRILNRTPVVNTMLCFANVAVHVDENYQVIFPPSTQFGTHHHKREFIGWPIADGRYGGWDFQNVDVSWFKNHIASNSIFAWNYEDDFLAGYDHGKRAGLMSVADHNIVPGKKLWTWGNGPRGRMWDQILTDEDGPYIELMVGAYSDNQPDYSWLQPYEVKSFEQYWYPFREIGGAKNATLDAAVNLEVKDRTAEVGFYTTSVHDQATAMVKAKDTVLLEERISIDPARAYTKRFSLPAGVDEHDLRASISVGGRELVSYSPVRREPQPMPPPVEAPLAPKDIKTNEELYLTGLRIEQFHNPNLEPDPYWEEALRRDPGDSRVNTALGINYLKKARFEDAEKLFRKALERLTDKYTTPKDMEPIYYLGLALRAQGQSDEAFKHFYKATWSAAWRAPGYYSLAEIASSRGDRSAALDFVERSLEFNSLNVRALNLKSALLRHHGATDQALAAAKQASEKSDPLDVRVLAESWLSSRSQEAEKRLTATMLAHPATAIETAAEYLGAGLWQDGSEVLRKMIDVYPDKSRVHPMVYYYLAYFAEKLGQDTRAAEYREAAVRMPPDYVFPFEQEAIVVLRHAMQANPRDARAPYYLGNLLFDWQPDEATRLWERSVSLDPSFSIAHRNLGIAYSHQKTGISLEKAIASLEKAVSLDRKYPVHFYELDQLYEAAGVAPEKRLAIFEKHADVVRERDDAESRAIALKVTMGKYDEAIAMMTGRQFEVWEGSSLNVADHWVDAHLLRGRERMARGKNREALKDFEAALQIPENLPSERRSGGGRESEVCYWVGVAHEALRDQTKAREFWRRSTASERERNREEERGPLGSIQLYYRALSLQKMGENDRAAALFRDVLGAGQKTLEAPETDFFASFGERQSQRARVAAGHYLVGLGHLGLEDRRKAKAEFQQAQTASPDHLGARTALKTLD
jgi:tetratricopeptide (TPR) repeat protein